MSMLKFFGNKILTSFLLAVLVICLFIIYIYSYLNLDFNLQSIYDEGFFYTMIVNRDKSTIGVIR